MNVLKGIKLAHQVVTVLVVNEKDYPKNSPKRKIPQYIFSAIAGAGGFCLGAVSGWNSPALPSLTEETAFNLTVSLESIIAAAFTVGSILSSLFFGYVIQKIGRSRSINLLQIPLAAGWLAIGLAQNVEMLIAGRILTGFCTGSLAIVIPVYTAEITEKDVRGKLAALFPLLIDVGVLFCFTLGSFVKWKELSYANAMIPIALFFASLFLPESPRYLVANGKLDEAKKSLMRLRGANHEMEISEEFNLLVDNNEKVGEKLAIQELLKDIRKKSAWWPITIVLMLVLFSRTCGFGALLSFSVKIFQKSNAHMDSFTSSVIIGVMQVFGTIASVSLVDKVGRRILWLISTTSVASCLCISAIFYGLKENDIAIPINADIHMLGVWCIYIWMVSLALATVPYLLIGEIVPYKFIGPVSSAATFITYCASLIITLTFQPAVLSLGLSGIFTIYACFTFTAAIFAYFSLPETSNKTLDEIQQMFQKPQNQC